MTFSELIAGTVPHHNKYSNRNGQPIVRVIPHHHAAVSDAGLKRLTDPDQQASANYIIMNNGQIFGQVPEEFRPWTSGSFEADAPSITFEIQNSGVAVNSNDNDPNSWPISSAAYNSTVRLIADIAKRYKWGAVAAGNVRGHREFFQTACPGGYVWNRLSYIRASAHSILIGTLAPAGSTPAPAPSTPPIKGKTVWELANEVQKGLHGSGVTRQKSLGAQYNAVQAEVNRRLAAPKAALPPRVRKTLAQLADEVVAGVWGSGEDRKRRLGANYNVVQAEVNRRLGGARPKGLSISQMADKVLRGDYGSGDARVKALGANYAAVQAEVNRRLA